MHFFKLRAFLDVFEFAWLKFVSLATFSPKLLSIRQKEEILFWYHFFKSMNILWNFDSRLSQHFIACRINLHANVFANLAHILSFFFQSKIYITYMLYFWCISYVVFTTRFMRCLKVVPHTLKIIHISKRCVLFKNF